MRVWYCWLLGDSSLPGTYPVTPARDQLAVYLTHLAHGQTLVELKNTYGQSEATHRKSIQRVSAALVAKFQSFITTPPTADELATWEAFNRYHVVFRSLVSLSRHSIL